MAGEKSKTPADVLARQRAERRVWVALDGMSLEDQVQVMHGIWQALDRKQRDEKRAEVEKYQTGGSVRRDLLDVGEATMAPNPRFTPAGTEQQ